jgi:hypothetical protein
VAQAHLVSIYGASVTGAGNDAFLKGFSALSPGQQPLANANYAYDAVITLALAQTYAKSTDGKTVAKDMGGLRRSSQQWVLVGPRVASRGRLREWFR